MARRIGMVGLLLLLVSTAGNAQVGARDLRERILDRQRTMWRYQMNMTFQSMAVSPFCPPGPVVGLQQIQYAYFQQLHQGGYLPAPVPLVPPPIVGTPPLAGPATVEERRLLREAELLTFREAPGMRRLELARLIAKDRPDLARQLLEQAIAEAGENSPVAQLARQQLRKLDAP